MFADNNPDFAITVRDYGLLVTLRKESPSDAHRSPSFGSRTPRLQKKATDSAPKPGK